MEVVYVLLPVGLILAAVAVATFVWAVRRGQYDDLDTPPLRMLGDDDPASGRDRGGPGAGQSTSE